MRFLIQPTFLIEIEAENAEEAEKIASEFKCNGYSPDVIGVTELKEQNNEFHIENS